MRAEMMATKYLSHILYMALLALSEFQVKYF